MDIATLNRALTATGNNLTVTGTSLQSSSIQTLFENFFPNGALTLQNPVLTPNGEKTTLSGQLSTPFLSLSNLSVLAAFSIVNGKI